MDFLLIAGLLIISVVVAVQSNRIRELRDELTKVRKQIASTNQSHVRSMTRSSSTPRVDARARTTKRDTPDIPARGARIVRNTRRTNASSSGNRELQEYPGDSAEAKWEFPGFETGEEEVPGNGGREEPLA